jgi:hypothetical protein|tara:strand:+ start:578 stop:2101 length:1524 start_codon:yes stop_codon:yes gene_type:complete
MALANRTIREKAENSLAYFAHLVNPQRVYGDIHLKMFEWWTRDTAKDCQLVLLPRDHQKSHCAAVRCAWDLTRNPMETILYVSATADLAEKQLLAIKQMLESPQYRKYWPEMVLPDVGKRERWTTTEIIVDSPVRKLEMVRDPSVKAAGLTANITGFHATRVYLDDLVVPDNAYTDEGRKKVEALYSQLASIETTGAQEVVVGTRYHPQDLYQTLLDMKEEVFDDDGEIIGEADVYEIFSHTVEDEGVFLWPKSGRGDGKFFGFDIKELARKKAKYVDTAQFYAQYYNNPNDPGLDRINRSKFQYYERSFVKHEVAGWFIRGQKLNVYAAVDFAGSLRKRADYSAIVVIGMTADRQIYVLEIDRFKTDKISEYYRHIFDLYKKWGFRKLRAECTSFQSVIVKDIKDNYIVKEGIALSIDEFRPTRHIGSKDERITGTLEPRYDNMQIWHYKGGLCTYLEEEVVLANPPHDDIKDALASAIDVAMPPVFGGRKRKTNIVYHPRFGGVG